MPLTLFLYPYPLICLLLFHSLLCSIYYLTLINVWFCKASGVLALQALRQNINLLWYILSTGKARDFGPSEFDISFQLWIAHFSTVPFFKRKAHGSIIF
ncbi:uncharacterized protein LOC113467151 isoform X2 [Diaphorina citri]|uniref:Uncharacterized protein LOC113467151 isoform X2 n=1 Tax=Diaphorina citri TaxID=121845 RepID=A0A3Q0IRT2_DIACI|nr:uncharacterized protein LOC113467151 isoform X2 [Diaphorina citri]